MKKLSYLIVLALILGLVLAGCSLLSNIGQAPATGQSGITYLTKGPAPNLVGLWHLDEGMGATTVADSSGNGNTGTVVGATTGVAGTFGKALSFDGVDDYVDCGEAVDNSITTALTIEVWLNYNTPAQRGGILSNDIPFLSKKGFNLGLWDDGKIYWDVGNGTALGRTSYAMPDSGWHHVVGTWDGSTVTLYVDGASVGTASLSGSYAGPNQRLWIGKCNNVSHPTHNYPFNGLIDEVRIWSSALTAAQLGDTTPPVVKISFPIPDGLVDWFVTSPVVGSVTATDPSYVTAIDVTGATLSYVTGLGTTTASGTLTVSAEGINGIIATATDGVDNSGAGPGSVNTATIKIDTQKPVVTVSLPGTGVYLLNEVVSADWSATDALSGVVPPSTGTISIDTSSVGTGKILTIAAGTAVDVAGNESLAVEVTYSVQYGFNGLLPPYTALKAFKIGSSIPLKWQYTDAYGNVVDSSLADPRVRIVLAGVIPPVTEDLIMVDDPGMSGLRYDSITNTNMWIFNWQTKLFTAGTYYIWITSVQTGQRDGPFPIQLR
jgi:hypothetical protein